ncbi:hypothetical protein H5410_042761 [Solanum commersonii]|uniref:Uncharacterized protein n=1 Tax=Solanum commersonii TaxID=4109 RepID=A0A9J5XX94_SOLCO|nr:hypothetical protein H5410_042761 [Solanum commersonii]
MVFGQGHPSSINHNPFLLTLHLFQPKAGLGTATPMPEKVMDVKNHQIWARYPLDPMGARFHQFLNVIEAHPKIGYKRSLGSHLKRGGDPKNLKKKQSKNREERPKSLI